jgi:hypothetical protein
VPHTFGNSGVESVELLVLGLYITVVEAAGWKAW